MENKISIFKETSRWRSSAESPSMGSITLVISQGDQKKDLTPLPRELLMTSYKHSNVLWYIVVQRLLKIKASK